jgi:hypothetical protein
MPAKETKRSSKEAVDRWNKVRLRETRIPNWEEKE